MATRDRFRATSVGRPWIAFVLGALALACSSTDSGMHFQFANEGTICLFAAGDQTSSPSSPFPQPMSVSYAAGDVASIAVQFPTCLAGSCTRAAMASCTVSGSGSALQVTSEGSYTEQGQTCTLECRSLIARCPTPPLAAGTTTFAHGTTTLSVTVPFAGAPPCAGGPPP